MKRFLNLILACAVAGAAHAILPQKMVLKNGSVLYGYLQLQDGNGQLTFKTDSALISVSGSNVQVEDREESDSTVICNIVFQSGSSSVSGDGRNFEYYLHQSGRRADGVRLLEEGAWVKYEEHTPNEYIVTWKDIAYIRSERRPSTILSGINRICHLKDGQTVEGQLAEETEDMQKLYLPNGLVRSFRIDDVVKCEYVPLNPSQDILSQAELIDIIKTQSSNKIRGVIIEQNYEGRGNGDYFRIQTGSTTQKVLVSDIAEVSKEVNSDYSLQSDVILDGGEVFVNRQKATTVSVTEKENILKINDISEAVVIEQSADGKATITVEYHSEGDAPVEVYKLVAVKTFMVKKNRNYGFSYKALANAFRPVKLETSPNHTTRAEYILEDTGYFALYDTRSEEAIVIDIQQKEEQESDD